MPATAPILARAGAGKISDPSKTPVAPPKFSISIFKLPPSLFFRYQLLEFHSFKVDQEVGISIISYDEFLEILLEDRSNLGFQGLRSERTRKFLRQVASFPEVIVQSPGIVTP